MNETYAVAHDLAMNEFKGVLLKYINEYPDAAIHALADVMIVAVVAAQMNNVLRAKGALQHLAGYMVGNVEKQANHMKGFLEANEKMEHSNAI